MTTLLNSMFAQKAPLAKPYPYEGDGDAPKQQYPLESKTEVAQASRNARHSPGSEQITVRTGSFETPLSQQIVHQLHFEEAPPLQMVGYLESYVACA